MYAHIYKHTLTHYIDAATNGHCNPTRSQTLSNFQRSARCSILMFCLLFSRILCSPRIAFVFEDFILYVSVASLNGTCSDRAVRDRGNGHAGTDWSQTRWVQWRVLRVTKGRLGCHCRWCFGGFAPVWGLVFCFLFHEASTTEKNVSEMAPDVSVVSLPLTSRSVPFKKYLKFVIPHSCSH